MEGARLRQEERAIRWGELSAFQLQRSEVREQSGCREFFQVPSRQSMACEAERHETRWWMVEEDVEQLGWHPPHSQAQRGEARKRDSLERIDVEALGLN